MYKLHTLLLLNSCVERTCTEVVVRSKVQRMSCDWVKMMIDCKADE